MHVHVTILHPIFRTSCTEGIHVLSNLIFKICSTTYVTCTLGYTCTCQFMNCVIDYMYL